MHELAIAQQMIETAVASLPAMPVMEDVQILSMRIRLGLLAGVSKEELLFGFSVVSQETPFEGALLEVEDEPVVAYCPQCDLTFVVTEAAELDVLGCPKCASTVVHIMEGKGITIQSLEVRDESDDG